VVQVGCWHPSLSLYGGRREKKKRKGEENKGRVRQREIGKKRPKERK
jgi:hypothetical protein